MQAKQNTDRLELIHTQLDEKVSALHDHLQEMLMALQRTEELLQRRLAAVEERVSDRVKKMTQQSRDASEAWIAPFVFLVTLCGLVVTSVPRKRVSCGVFWVRWSA